MTFSIEPIDPAQLPESVAAYTHGTVVEGARRIVFVSGQPPWSANEPLPQSFEEQCRLAWRNVERVLAEAGMSLRNLAKVTIYLADRKYRAANSQLRADVLGDHRPALTVIIADIYSEEWLLEIEGIAVG